MRGNLGASGHKVTARLAAAHCHGRVRFDMGRQWGRDCQACLDVGDLERSTIAKDEGDGDTVGVPSLQNIHRQKLIRAERLRALTWLWIRLYDS